MPDNQRPESLKRQLEMARFERALQIAESMAEHRSLLTTAELGRLNNVVTGHKDDHDPWRINTAVIELPSGKMETLSVISDPKMNCREKLHRATEVAESGAVIDAAVEIYADLVLAHAFEDANRRTAVLASHYFLASLPHQFDEALTMLGPDRLMFASDYPHWDFDPPDQALPASLTPALREAILGGTAAALYPHLAKGFGA